MHPAIQAAEELSQQTPYNLANAMLVTQVRALCEKWLILKIRGAPHYDELLVHPAVVRVLELSRRNPDDPLVVQLRGEIDKLLTPPPAGARSA